MSDIDSDFEVANEDSDPFAESGDEGNEEEDPFAEGNEDEEDDPFAEGNEDEEGDASATKSGDMEEDMNFLDSDEFEDALDGVLSTIRESFSDASFNKVLKLLGTPFAKDLGPSRIRMILFQCLKSALSSLPEPDFLSFYTSAFESFSPMLNQINILTAKVDIAALPACPASLKDRVLDETRVCLGPNVTYDELSLLPRLLPVHYASAVSKNQHHIAREMTIRALRLTAEGLPPEDSAELRALFVVAAEDALKCEDWEHAQGLYMRVFSEEENSTEAGKALALASACFVLTGGNVSPFTQEKAQRVKALEPCVVRSEAVWSAAVAGDLAQFDLAAEVCRKEGNKEGQFEKLLPLLRKSCQRRRLVKFLGPFEAIPVQMAAEACGMDLDTCEEEIVDIVREGTIRGRLDRVRHVLRIDRETSDFAKAREKRDTTWVRGAKQVQDVMEKLPGSSFK